MTLCAVHTPDIHEEVTMRPTIAIRLLSPAVLCAALALPSVAHASVVEHATPVASGAAVAVNGLYSLTVRGADAQQRVDLILVKNGDTYTGRLVTFDQEVELEGIQVDGNVLKAHVVTNFGKAWVTLRVSEKDISGTFSVAKKNLSVSGERVY